MNSRCSGTCAREGLRSQGVSHAGTHEFFPTGMWNLLGVNRTLRGDRPQPFGGEQGMDVGAAFCRYHAAVTPEGADYNGHMNVATFPVHFEEATRILFEELDISRAYKERTN